MNEELAKVNLSRVARSSGHAGERVQYERGQ